MAEQWIRLFAVDRAALDGFVGSNDRAQLDAILEAEGADEVGELLGERDAELAGVLAEIASGELDTGAVYLYRRVLEVVATSIGVDTFAEAIMPGRGWQELGPAWARWGVESVGRVWGGAPSGNKTLPWPWTDDTAPAECWWPIAAVFAASELGGLIADLEAFDPKVIAERGVPDSISRFSEADYWPLDDLATEIAGVVEALLGGARVARSSGTDLLLWHDGQQ